MLRDRFGMPVAAVTAFMAVTALLTALPSTCALPSGTFKSVRQASGEALTNEQLQALVDHLARQTMLQQLAAEERVRSEGGSGIKQTRQNRQGSKTYMATTYGGDRVAAIHDHSNNERVVGMGEFIGVLNGVEFRTRHNDYKLVKPSNDSEDYHKVDLIVYPPVPPEVEEKDTVEEQVIEMREWFKAWATQNTTHRNYIDYFKAILCYLEGAWTLSDSDKIEESFDSDRHQIDASSWFDLQEKIRFTSYTGRKQQAENYAYLPTTILDAGEGHLTIAQWNYRILCHPIQRDIKRNRLVHIDDLHVRMAKKKTLEEALDLRFARFKMAPVDKDKWSDNIRRYEFLDELMGEIPGKNNYPGFLEDDALGQKALHYRTGETLNAARYHRWFKTKDSDAMGESTQHRAFSDENLFMAMTSHPHIAPMTLNLCNRQGCQNYTQRWTYAIPMELIYLTPLYNWNPYNIEFKGAPKTPAGRTVTAGKRNGASRQRALNGTATNTYFRTPSFFYGSGEDTTDLADTGTGATWVLNETGEAHQVVASGTRIFLREIPGVGRPRLRHPMMPTHQEGGAVWKELDALKDIVLNPQSEANKFYEPFPAGSGTGSGSGNPSGGGGGGGGGGGTGGLEFVTRPSSADFGSHVHSLTFTPEDMETLLTPGANVTVVTAQAHGHTHTLVIELNDAGNYKYITCDGRKACFDKHGRLISRPKS